MIFENGLVKRDNNFLQKDNVYLVNHQIGHCLCTKFSNWPL